MHGGGTLVLAAALAVCAVSLPGAWVSHASDARHNAPLIGAWCSWRGTDSVSCKWGVRQWYACRAKLVRRCCPPLAPQALLTHDIH